MIAVDKVISELKVLYNCQHVRFDLPEYVQFHNDVTQFVYENHFEYTEEWYILQPINNPLFSEAKAGGCHIKR